MKAFRLLGTSARSRFLRTAYHAAAVAALSVAAPLLAGADTVTLSFSGAMGTVFSGKISPCQTTRLYLNVGGSGTSSANPNQGTPAGIGNLDILNQTCDGGNFYISAYGFPVQFFSAPSANGTQVPSVLTASGQFPVTTHTGVFPFNYPDVITFQLTLQAAGPATENLVTFHSTLPFGPSGTGPITQDGHYDSTLVPATATLSISSQLLGPLTFDIDFANIESARSHTVTLTVP